jgi:5-methylcytosine-specific restriction endonuclease McrA
MTRRLSYEEVFKALADAGCVLLETTYVNARTPMRYTCECGNESTIVYDSFKRGRRCKSCGIAKMVDKQRFDFETVKQTFEESDCLLLETHYINTSTPMRYICACGNESSITFGRFKSGGRCMTCGTEKAAKTFRLDFEYIKKYFEDNGCQLLDTEYKNNIIPLRFICSCGNAGSVDFYRFRHGVRCKSCGYAKQAESQRLDAEYVISSFAQRGFTVLSNYISSNDTLDCQCSSGHLFKLSYANFSKGVGCRHCFWESNRGENHPKWNTELTDEDRERERNIPGIYEWRQGVFLRDDYTCQRCGSRGVTLNAHHILNYYKHKHLRTELSNGITLCESCHKGFHKEFGSKDNNQQQINEYLTTRTP